MTEAPHIGPTLRAARGRRNLSLAALAEKVGVTKGFLSEVERDLVSPSVGTLIRICHALELPIAQLFEGADQPLVRAGERPPIAFGGIGVTEYRLTPASEQRVLVLQSEIAPGGGSGDEPYALANEVEVAHVLDGTLEIDLDGVAHTLAAGDSLTFGGGTPRQWRNPSAALPARVLWVLVPGALE